MVAGRTDERIDVVDDPVEDGIDGGDAATRRQECDLVAPQPERGQAASITTAGRRQVADPLVVVGGVDAPDLLSVAGTRGSIGTN